MFFLATGQYPFFGKDRATLCRSITSCYYEETLIEDLSLRNLIVRCLDFQPEYRPLAGELLSMPYFTENNSNLPILYKNESCHKLIKPQLSKRRSSGVDNISLSSKLKFHRNSSDIRLL